MISIKDLNNFTRIIAYDDDNHGVRIFVNGYLIDNMDNGLEAAVHLITAGQNTARTNPILTADIYLPEIEAENTIINNIHNLLSMSVMLTPKQEIAILNKTYEKI